VRLRPGADGALGCLDSPSRFPKRPGGLAMKKVLMLVLTALGVAAFALSTHAPARAAGANDWSLNATLIEACSCPMFCQCYFNAKPAGHSAMSGSMAG